MACSPVGKVEWAPAFNRGIVVFKSNEKKERAMCDFVEYFTNKENSVRWCMSIDSLSPFNDATDIQEYRNYIQENKILIAASETMEYAYGTPAIIGASQVRTELKNMFLSIVGEQKSVQDAFNDAVSKCNSALKENRNDD